MIYSRDEGNHRIDEPLVVSIDLEDIKVTRSRGSPQFCDPRFDDASSQSRTGWQDDAEAGDGQPQQHLARREQIGDPGGAEHLEFTETCDVNAVAV
jgi:hypothetical protein